MSSPIKLTLPIVVLLLGACATTRYQAKLPETGKDCVDDLRSLPYIPLRYLAPDDKAGSRHVEFADIARCHRTPDAGAAPVALYQLDGVMPPAQIAVSVTLSTGGTMAAAVDLLDGDFRLLKRYGFQEFVRRGSEYSLDIFLNETGNKPAYLLISPDRTQLGKSDTAVGSSTSMLYLGTGYYYNGVETAAVRPFLEGGLIKIIAKPQGSAAFSKPSGK